jgi:hypothetical protein
MKFKVSAKRMRYFLSLVADVRYLQDTLENTTSALDSAQSALNTLNANFVRLGSQDEQRGRTIEQLDRELADARTYNNRRENTALISAIAEMLTYSHNHYGEYPVTFAAIRDDKKVLAVKTLRESFPALSLLEAKSIVEKLMEDKA